MQSKQSARTILVGLLVIALLAIVPAFGEVNQKMIDRVAAGKAKEAKASWWGFNEEDSTDALQAAINSGVRKLIVENMGKPWIVRPIFLVSNQEILFEKGVEVVAKRGYPEFKGGNDSLFTATLKENVVLQGYGATLRMHRDDYAKAPYLKAEWRNVLDFKGCSNVKVYGLTLAESGGDGILLIRHGRERNDGTSELVQCSNFHIKDVICDGNYRQGISVTSAVNLLIEKTIMRNTGGTEPSAGIDLEPDDPEENLVNVVLRDCLTENNAGYGYLTFLCAMAVGKSEPVSIRFENCRSLNDQDGGVGVANLGSSAAKSGSITFANCSFEKSLGPGISVMDNPITACKIRFEGCSITDPALDRPSVTPIQLNAYRGTGPVVGVDFGNLRILDPLNRKPISYGWGSTLGLSLEGITGTLAIDLGRTSAGKTKILAALPEYWAFRTDPDKVGERDQWFAPATKKGAPEWSFISTHKFWDAYTGDGWYALDQFIPKTEGKRVWLNFDSVDENYTLWINGHYVSDNLAAGLLMWDQPVNVEITGKFTEGQSNHIVMRVKNTGGAGGIWRPVTLMVEK